MTTTMDIEMEDTAVQSAAASEQNNLLPRSPSGGALAQQEAPREWVFPDGDELFRGIYTRAATGFGAAEVVAISSAINGEGKTTVGVGMAVTLAQDFPDRRVLLVETDLQHPVLAEDFDLEASPGLIDCLMGEPLLSVCRPTYLDNLHILPAGQAARVPGRPLRSSIMASVVDTMRQNYDVVILDLPAILTNSDAVLLTDLADGVVWVVRAGVTPLNMITRALEQVEDGKLRGVVLNGADTALPNWLRRLLG